MGNVLCCCCDSSEERTDEPRRIVRETATWERASNNHRSPGLIFETQQPRSVQRPAEIRRQASGTTVKAAAPLLPPAQQQRHLPFNTTNPVAPAAESSPSQLPLPRDIFANVHAQLRSTKATKTSTDCANRTSGSYASLSEYLRTHLQLLRGDFFGSLYEGIWQLRQQLTNSDFGGHTELVGNRSFWVYPDKCIELYEPGRYSNAKMVVHLEPDEVQSIHRANQARNQRQDNRRRYQKVDDDDEDDESSDDDDELNSKVPFMGGSLLLFTSSMDLDDLILATVVSTDLKNGLVVIHLHRAFKTTSILNESFIMLECKNFFAPYHQVHHRIGALTADTFPLRSQLISVSSERTTPVYLQNNHALVALMNANLNTATMNTGQITAIRHALSHRVALIQGPPGTGKTFVGLELVRLLLQHTKCRIVVVCNSNTALDQFLTGLVKRLRHDGDAVVKSVVRMGSQCKEAALQPITFVRPKCEGVNEKQLRTMYSCVGDCNETIAASLHDSAVDIGTKQLNKLLAAGSAAISRVEEFRQDCDYEGIKDKRLMAMTSSFAAKNGKLLGRWRAPIVIVEEAADLLEAHVIATLTKHTEHLIQIGDHQQLRPRTLSESSARELDLDISLFERLHNNHFPVAALSVQHRMHPHIADLLRPIIYAQLTDAAAVKKYPSVRGMPGRVMFVDHRFPERSAASSRTNPAEAHLVQRLCAYLLQQGYTTDDITVLCTYRAQCALLQTDRQSGRCHGCRIAVVDEFQSRESRIVVLSLVRNNRSGQIGFMSSDNRACVALSRAREGLFMFGHMQMMAAHNRVWAHVQRRLVATPNGLGNRALVVRCERHGNETKIMKATDFAPIADGGCRAQCHVRLPCSHACQQQCHGQSLKHVCPNGCRLN